MNDCTKLPARPFEGCRDISCKTTNVDLTVTLKGKSGQSSHTTVHENSHTRASCPTEAKSHSDYVETTLHPRQFCFRCIDLSMPGLLIGFPLCSGPAVDTFTALLLAEALMLQDWHINDTQMSFIRPQT